MKIILAILASVLIVQVYAGIPEVRGDLTAEECLEAVHCIVQKFNETEFELEADSTVVVNMVRDLVGVITGYIECQRILSDPPSRWEEIQHQTCMARWTIEALVTVVRVQIIVSQASETVRETWRVVQITCSDGRPLLPCINNMTPDPEATEIAPYQI